MIIKHIAKRGDCLSKIAAKYRSTPERVWNLPDNSELRQKRKDMNVLFVGDEVAVELKDKTAKVASGSLHSFKVLAPSVELKIKLEDSLGLPRADLSYRLVSDKLERSGKTDADGIVNEKVPPHLTAAKLFIGDDDKEGIDIEIGGLDPIDELSGVQARLNNLGFDAGKEDGIMGPRTEEAIRNFQTTAGLDPTGVIDDDTRAALAKAHGDK
jgi:hypothetical protein